MSDTIFWIIISAFFNWCMYSIRNEMNIASFVIMLIVFNIMFILCWDLGSNNIPEE